MDTTDEKLYIRIPIEITPKGKTIITMDQDEYEWIESGTKVKNGHLVYFHKYKKL